ncbi:MAG: hypothetical protein IM473_05455 [Microcystis sp. M015S2]|uniref:hypothetical protein n=1 Tax=unclassified Microcystis TaxID=2643300 RepID=UPI0025869A29|nr:MULTISPECIES: hypothetical protein [unclassified Microcystis]MCA2709076.1 hypothetical protein [Microcystis sp. M025S2]MCA2741867.1 hypothetical protein [Microcystis sp. M015S2]MCA2759768.1 hypothetical protein [Microcystis sp. M145S2]
MGQLDQCTVKTFCQENNIKLIIDVCHAHAQIIWQLAINYATLTNIPPIGLDLELAFSRLHFNSPKKTSNFNDIIDLFRKYYV